MRGIIQLCLLFIFSVHLAGQAPHAFFIEEDTEVCNGDSGLAYIQIVGGTAPYTVVISYDPWGKITLTDIGPNYDLWITPEYTTTYRISSVVDSEGVSGTFQSSTVRMQVFPVNPVQILMDQTLYKKSDPSVPLISNPDGAVFSGSGVLGSNFYPEYVPPESSPHSLSCIYTNAYGCPTYDTVEVSVIYGEAEVELRSGGVPVTTICDENGSYEIVGSNQDNIPGLFALRSVSTGQFLTGYIVDEDSSDNAAVFTPAGLSGLFELFYTYSFDILTIQATQQINVNDIESMTIEGFPDVVCDSDDPYLISPGNITFDPGAVFSVSGPGVSGNMATGYFFDPGADAVLTGNSTIELDYTSSNGCSASVSKTVTNHVTPGLSFTYSPSCLSSEGGTVAFNNTTTGKYLVDSWTWNFGDTGSGSMNESTEQQANHFYDIPGVKTVTLTAETVDGCVVSVEQEAILSDQPMADMTWFHDCYAGEGEISFQDRSISNFSTISSLEWTFMTEEGLTIGGQTSQNPDNIVRFRFPSVDNYQVQLKVWDQAGCVGQVTRELSLRPTITLTPAGYHEDFNGLPDSWTTAAEDQSSWTAGLPAFTGHETVPGDYAWYTVLPSENPAYEEQSWVESPCFDFSQSTKPMISMDVMKSFVPGEDGAVLQYYDGTGGDWKTVGAVGDGINWYNLSSISNEPGGSSFGWGLDQFIPDVSWVNAKYTMKELSRKRNVKFRIVLGSGAATASGNDGFAFDNFSITEDFRGSVLEHFTNSSQLSSKSADDVVDAYAADNRDIVVDVQYHTDYPGNDPMNENNPYASTTRAAQTGALSAPYAILNGRQEPEFRYDFSGPGEEPDVEILEQESLETAPFQLYLQVEWGGDRLEATASTFCTAESFGPNVDLYMVVMETSVTAYTGENQDEEFRNVVLDMLPTPAGKLLGGDWTLGETISKTYSWDYPDYVEDIEDLAVLAFVTNRDNNGAILQATATYLTPQVGVRETRKAEVNLAVYPNPASHMVYVNLGDEARKNGSIVITDLSGKRVMESEVQTGYSIFRLDVSLLPEGMYMINWLEAGSLKGRSKLVRTR